MATKITAYSDENSKLYLTEAEADLASANAAILELVKHNHRERDLAIRCMEFTGLYPEEVANYAQIILRIRGLL